MADGHETTELVAVIETMNADDLHAALDKIMVQQGFGPVGTMFIEHHELGQITKLTLVKRSLTDGSEVHDIKLTFEGDSE